MSRKKLLSFFSRRSSAEVAGPIVAGAGSPPIKWAFADYSRAILNLDKAEGLMRRRLFAEAEPLLLDARHHMGGDRRLLLALAIVAHEEARWPDAQARWEEVIGVDPTVGYAHSNRAVAIQMQGNTDLAADLFRDLMFRFPDDLGTPIALTYLLQLIAADRRRAYLDAAKAGLEDRLSRNPQHVGLIKTQAYIARMEGKLKTAYERLTLAHNLAVNDEQIRKDLDEVLALLNAET